MCWYCKGDFQESKEAMPDRPFDEHNGDFEMGVRFQQHVIFQAAV